MWLSTTDKKDKAFPEPYSCAVCDWERNGHGMMYSSSAGMHFWIQPDERMILARMKARRNK